MQKKHGPLTETAGRGGFPLFFEVVARQRGGAVDCMWMYTVTLWSIRSCFCFFVTFAVFESSLSLSSSVTDFDFDFCLGLETWSSLPNHAALVSSHFRYLCSHLF